MKQLSIIVVALLLAGCPKKEESVAVDGAATTMTATSASSAPSASVTESAATPTDTTQTQTARAETVRPETENDDPTAAPTHEQHEKAANTSIQKSNFKSELDKLEKEDLNAVDSK